jgi:hypothetical protein
MIHVTELGVGVYTHTMGSAVHDQVYIAKELPFYIAPSVADSCLRKGGCLLFVSQSVYFSSIHYT